MRCATYLSGEALVAERAGSGEISVRTRTPTSLAGALFPLFPTRQGSAGSGPGQRFGSQGAG